MYHTSEMFKYKRSKPNPCVREYLIDHKRCRYALRHILTIGYMQNKYRTFYKIYHQSWLYAENIQTKIDTYSIQYILILMIYNTL